MDWPDRFDFRPDVNRKVCGGKEVVSKRPSQSPTAAVVLSSVGAAKRSDDGDGKMPWAAMEATTGKGFPAARLTID